MPTQICRVCGKSSGAGHNVSHSNRKTHRKWRPNLQRVRIKLGGTVMTAMVCARCIKGGKIVKAG